MAMTHAEAKVIADTINQENTVEKLIERYGSAEQVTGWLGAQLRKIGANWKVEVYHSQTHRRATLMTEKDWREKVSVLNQPRKNARPQRKGAK